MRIELFWSEKYRPHTIADCVLPKRLEDFFQSQVQAGDFIVTMKTIMRKADFKTSNKKIVYEDKI